MPDHFTNFFIDAVISRQQFKETGKGKSKAVAFLKKTVARTLNMRSVLLINFKCTIQYCYKYGHNVL